MDKRNGPAHFWTGPPCATGTGSPGQQHAGRFKGGRYGEKSTAATALYPKTKRGFFSWRGMGMARGLEIPAQLFNSGVRDEKQTARKFVNLRAVRWTVWD
jgi:hypothetical protein